MCLKKEEEPSLTTAADERGQSIIEFLVMLPLMVGLVVLLIRVNSAIQVSIVNQQYVRSQLLFLSYNSAFYPRLDHRVNSMANHGYNQMVLGMSEKALSGGDDFTESNDQPDAPVTKIRRGRDGNDDSQAEPDSRSRVRIRTSATLCGPITVIRGKNGAYLPLAELANFKPGSAGAAGNTQGIGLSEGVEFDYCRAPEGIYANE
jgi:hypothetical protein